ncbi:AMP-binding protein [Limobrevibacterium gyesilva]|uniref:AMP-binding protein n=1 Tax=Limobrevibacterium gyesilva TaxID=2991712 RepID=A0AA41YVC7_9PROT|nr:AMP-binding protein [Limobrevibacterium gyesilva]MCW3477218.1 AMP-binding protein [Limobrevibacterium gyesilva]
MDKDPVADTTQQREAALVGLAQDLARELGLRPQAGRRAALDMALGRDWGFDSLSRAELLLRIERALAIHLPAQLLQRAETLRDVLAALERAASATPMAGAAAPRPIVLTEAEPAPADAPTLTDVLDWHTSEHGDRTHLVLTQGDGQDVSLSYRELAERSHAVARGLRQRGVETGERIAIMLPTGLDFFVAFFGTLYAGAVPTPIYPPARPSQFAEHLARQGGILRNAGAALLIAAPEAGSVAALLRLQVGSLRGVATVDALAAGAGALPGPAHPDAMALLQYTSGSTGDPKGVVLSHANVLANIRAMGEAMDAGPADRFVSWLPLYHDMGLIGAWLGSLYFAAPLVVMPPITFLVRPEQWLWAIHRHRATLSAAPNFAFELCLRRIADAAIVGLDLGSLRMVANGSEAVSAETLRRFTARFAPYGFRAEAMAPVYGLAENAVGLTFPPLGRAPVVDRVRRVALTAHGRAEPAAPGEADALELVACGRPLRGHEIRIVGPAGELGERQEGRLQFRGPSATGGYFANPGKTADLIEGGWLNSGDLAYVAGGDVFITGRSKDIIIRAGQHIYPEEIERAVGDVPGIRKGCVAVFGVRDPRAGTEHVVVAAETRETDTARLDTLRALAAEAAARLLDAPPEQLVLLPPRSIPKTSSGKLRRAATRALFEQGQLGRRPDSPARQVLRLLAAGLLPQARRAAAAVAALAYAGWWWLVLIGGAVVAWPGVLLLPRLAWRWALLRTLAKLVLWLMRIRLDVTGTWPAVPRPIFVTNHASYFDCVVLAAVLPGAPVFIAKNELAAQAIAGPFLRALETLFVDRSDPEGGVEDTRTALAAAAAGRALVFFPEGTFTRAPGLLPFRLGAFVIAAQQGLDVIPVALHGTRSVLRGGQWWPRHHGVAVRIGAAVAPDGRDFAAAIRLRDKVRAAILAGCGEPDAGPP